MEGEDTGGGGGNAMRGDSRKCLPRAGINQAVSGGIDQQYVVLQKIHSKNRKLHCRQQECPLENLAMKGKRQLFLTPARYCIS
jgi:hypothetical protein